MNYDGKCWYFTDLAVKKELIDHFFEEIAYFYRYKGKMKQTREMAEVIRLHRKAAGLSRVQLAELAGVGKTVIYDVEKGKETVRLETLQKIFKVLNIQIVLTSPLLDQLSRGNEKG